LDPDRTLVARAALGSREAFDQLVDHYRHDVYRLVRALTAGDGDVEDLVQDIFVRAYRGIGRFRGDSAFHTWLYRIAVNVARSQVNRRRRRDVAFPDAAEDVRALEEIAVRGDLEETLLRRQAIDRALASLPLDRRILIVLRDIDGLKYEEIAAIVKLPQGTVESRLFRAHQRLRPLLEDFIPFTTPQRTGKKTMSHEV
jgi:RNA polymerase sigma-70 factor (ECF subfamily)